MSDSITVKIPVWAIRSFRNDAAKCFWSYRRERDQGTTYIAPELWHRFVTIRLMLSAMDIPKPTMEGGK